MVIGLVSVGLEMFKLSQKLFIGYNKSGSVKKHIAHDRREKISKKYGQKPLKNQVDFF